MKITEAMNILGLAVLCQVELKKSYRVACAKYHPDRNPAGLEIMKAVNTAYALLKEMGNDETCRADNTGFGDALNEAINAVINLDGINLEVCGNWVWLSGDTRPHKEAIKSAGYFWAAKKMMWYFRPAEWKRTSKGGGVGMDDIRAKYGSQGVKTNGSTKLN